MSVLGDLGKKFLDNVLGGDKKQSSESTSLDGRQFKKTGRKKDVTAVVGEGIAGLAAEKLKNYTPDSVDKIIDDATESLKS